MSQAKVDRYKEEKANRKKIMRKQKAKNAITAACGTIVCIAVVGWIGYSAYGYFRTQDEKGAQTQTEVNMDALNEYMTTLQASDNASE